MTEAKLTQPNRWDATWGEAATRDRIGDHTAARYRHFRRYIDEHDEAVDASLFAELVSVEELLRELQQYEDAGAFLLLALTGDLVEKLQHLNGVLDSAFAGGRVDLPEGLRNWQRQLDQERGQRTEMYDELLQHEERREEALPVEREGQLELLTMLKAGLKTYSKDSKLKEYPLTDAEEQLVSAAYDLLVSRSDIVIPPLPVWFWASTDASNESKLTRLGLSSSRPKSGTSEKVMETASQWWDLHHPHIVRFMGACHVGKSPYFVHERTRSLALYLGANGKTRADVWKRLLEAARGVEYLHRRGFVHKHLTPADFLCAEFEAKTLLSGMGLVACRSERSASAPASADIRDAWNTSGGIPECLVVEDERPSVASDIYSLGQCVFAFLGFAATSAGLGSAGSVIQCQDLPSHCPKYLNDFEWDLIRKMCAADLNHRVNMAYVVEKMQEIAYPVVDEVDGVCSTMGNLDEQVLPGWSDTVREFLDEFDKFSSEPGEPTRKAFTRLLQLHEMMKEAVPSPEPMVVNKYLSLLSRIMDAMDKRSSFSASIQATGSRYIDQTALTFNAEIERMFHLLNAHDGLHADPAPAFERSYFDKVQRMAQSRIETSVAECDGSADSSETQTSDEERREKEAVQQHLDRQTGEGRDQGNTRASTLPRWFVPQFEVETGAFIAKGGFGSVYRGQWYGTEVVVKEIILKKEDTPQQKRAEFLREANTWFQLNHRNVVKMYGGCHVGRLVFVCEYASQGSLDSFSKAEGRDPLLVWSTLLSGATGLRYLHDVGVVHGDLKGNNILIGTDGVAKLTDFGLSFFRKNADSEAEQGALGAPRWKAPECLRGKVATFASDIFSFGMCIIEAVSGALPWGNTIPDLAVKYHVTKGELPSRPPGFEDEEWELVQQMCCWDPTQRLNTVSVVVRLTAIVKRRDANRRQLLQTAYKSDMLADRENEWMDAHTGGLDTLLQLVQSGVASRQNAAKYSMQTFSALTPGNVLAEQELLQVVKLFHSDDTKQDWAAIALGYVNCPCSAIRADVMSLLVGLIERENDRLLKAEAVRAIGYLASDETSRTLIVSHGAIPALLEMMSAGAAWTLGRLAIGCEPNQVAIADTGAIDALVSLILRGSYQQRIEGALALRRLAGVNAKISMRVSSTCRDAFLHIRYDARHRDAARMLEEIARMRGEDESKDKDLFPALVDSMLYGDDQQKNEAQTILYACGHDRKNDRVKISRDPVAILIAFVRVGTAEEKRESARVLGRLADDGDDANRIAICAPLVALVRDGTDDQKVNAAEVLSRLADGNDANRIVIAQEGGIGLLVALVRDGTDSQKANAAEALGRLAAGNDANRNAIAQEGGIVPLVALVRDGTDDQKANAAEALGRLADGNDANRIAICASLVALVRDGTDLQKENAAEALSRLADGNDANRIAIVQEGGIAPLVALVRDGTDSQKANAAEALGRLAAGNDANRVAIAQEGGIAPLVTLVRNGTDSQKENAVEALGRLADGNDANRIAICAPLVALVRNGTGRQKENAAEVLGRLADGNDANRIAICAQLVALVRGGTYSQKVNAAEVLSRLADGNNMNRIAIAQEGGIAPLVALVRDGTDLQKENAAEALGRLADGNDANRIAIAQEGGIAPLVALVRDGTDWQKENAAEALGRLADGNNMNRIAIVQEGGISPLVALVRDGLATGLRILAELTKDPSVRSIVLKLSVVKDLLDVVRDSPTEANREPASIILMHLVEESKPFFKQLEPVSKLQGYHRAITEAGLIPSIILNAQIISKKHQRKKRIRDKNAFSVLVSISETKECKSAIAQAEGIATLVAIYQSIKEMSEDGTDPAVLHVIDALANLSEDEECRKKFAEKHDMWPLLHFLWKCSTIETLRPPPDSNGEPVYFEDENGEEIWDTTKFGLEKEKERFISTKDRAGQALWNLSSLDDNCKRRIIDLGCIIDQDTSSENRQLMFPSLADVPRVLRDGKEKWTHFDAIFGWLVMASIDKTHCFERIVWNLPLDEKSKFAVAEWCYGSALGEYRRCRWESNHIRKLLKKPLNRKWNLHRKRESSVEELSDGDSVSSEEEPSEDVKAKLIKSICGDLSFGMFKRFDSCLEEVTNVVKDGEGVQKAKALGVLWLCAQLLSVEPKNINPLIASCKKAVSDEGSWQEVFWATCLLLSMLSWKALRKSRRNRHLKLLESVADGVCFLLQDDDNWRKFIFLAEYVLVKSKPEDMRMRPRCIPFLLASFQRFQNIETSAGPLDDDSFFQSPHFHRKAKIDDKRMLKKCFIRLKTMVKCDEVDPSTKQDIKQMLQDVAP